MNSNALEKLIHDVNSKCATLRDAAPLLREAAPAEARELLRLMAQQARGLADLLEEFERLESER